MKGIVDLSPKKKVDVSDFTFDDAHMNQVRHHAITREEAVQFIQESDISFTKWNGRFVNYYGPNGAVFLDVENKNIRTAFSKNEFDEPTQKMREVLKRNE